MRSIKFKWSKRAIYVVVALMPARTLLTPWPPAGRMKTVWGGNDNNRDSLVPRVLIVVLTPLAERQKNKIGISYRQQKRGVLKPAICVREIGARSRFLYERSEDKNNDCEGQFLYSDEGLQITPRICWRYKLRFKLGRESKRNALTPLNCLINTITTTAAVQVQESIQTTHSLPCHPPGKCSSGYT